MTRTLKIQQASLACVQDLGRPHGAQYGLPANGAMDHFSCRAANILARNEQTAAVIEITALDFAATPGVDTLIAVTGAPAEVTVDGLTCPQWLPVSVRAGQRLAIRNIRGGLRTYLAVHGSFEADTYMGSVSPDPVLGFGTLLHTGHEITLLGEHPPVEHPVYVHPLYRPGFQPPTYTDTTIIDVTEGPDVADFGDTAENLYTGEFTMTERSNTIGLRLTGPLPKKQTTGEMLSRGVPVGAIEVPTGSELLILHRGRGVTAGYPVLAVTTLTGLSALAQVPPGNKVRFRQVTVEKAAANYRAERSRLDTLEETMKAIFDGIESFSRAA
ncbi:biotin-dependent carboxyltransferase family protein [Pseudarthrobacter sp. NPDC055928]|uniref:5-oxoprolinase subunit C family protein n=1 Tax=Pseudarthrobacter sp. NPDC055928 TaxID=3345661 RepID=UPI0035E22662